MKIGIVSSSYFRYGDDFVAGMKKIKSLGYDCIDYGIVGQVDSELCKLPQAEFEQYFLDTKKAAEEIGIELHQAHGPWRYPPQDATEEDRAERFEKMCRSIEATAILGIKNWIIHPIMPFGCWENPDPEAFYALNFDFFSRLVKVAEKHGVVINFENMPFPALTLSRPQEIVDFVKAIDSPNMKVCLDTGHCIVCKEDLAESVKAVGKDYLATLHVHDNRGKGQDEHFLPMFGAKDWRDYSHADMFMNFAKALKEIGFDGVLSIETDAHGKEMPEAIRDRYQKALVMIAKYMAAAAE